MRLWASPSFSRINGIFPLPFHPDSQSAVTSSPHLSFFLSLSLSPSPSWFFQDAMVWTKESNVPSCCPSAWTTINSRYWSATLSDSFGLRLQATIAQLLPWMQWHKQQQHVSTQFGLLSLWGILVSQVWQLTFLTKGRNVGTAIERSPEPKPVLC